ALGSMNKGIQSLYNCFPQNVQNLTDAVIEKELKGPIVNMAADLTRTTAKNIAAYLVDSYTDSFIGGIEASLFNRTVNQIFVRHPLLGCAVFILGPGSKQSVKQLSL